MIVSMTLNDHALAIGDDVEVELIVADPGNGVRRVEGRVVDATPAVLIVEPNSGGRRRTRIPWGAIAAIRDAYVPHPGA